MMYKSKQSRKKTIDIKFLASSIALATTVGLLHTTVTPVYASAFSDTTTHWAKESIDRWAEYGVIAGYEGMFHPDNNITRGDMAVIVNKIMDYQVIDVNSYEDLQNDVYYSQPVLKLSAAKIMTGDTDKNMNPTAFITRQEACVVLCNALHIPYETVEYTGFADDDVIASWAKGAVLALKEQGLVSGIGENYFAPLDNITRGEVTTILNQGIASFYQESGFYSQDVSGNVVVRTSDVTLADMVITGDLILAEGVADGEVYLKNLQVLGKVIVKGGGKNSIYMEDVAVTQIYVDRVDGDSRVVMSGDTQVDRVTVASLSTVEAVNLSADGFVAGVVVESGTGCSINGTFETVEILADDAMMNIQGEIANLTVEGAGGNLILTDLVVDAITCGGSGNEIHLLGETSVVTFDFSPMATDSVLNVGEDTVINMVNVTAEGISVVGEGTVETVHTEGNNTNIQTEGTEVSVADGVSGTTAGDVEVEGGSSTTTDSSEDSSTSDDNTSDNSSSDNDDNNDDDDDYDDYDDYYDDDDDDDYYDDDDDYYDDNDDYDEEEEEEIYYTVSFSLVYDGTITTTMVPSGDTLSAPTSPSRTGYTFLGWTTDINGTNPYIFDENVVTEDITLYGQWEEIPVIFSLNHSTLELTATESATLVGTFSDGSTDDTITWFSSRESVATAFPLDSQTPETAMVMAFAEGTSIITATTADGKSATCEVIVTEKIEVSGVAKAVAELAEQNNTVTIPSYDGVSESSIKSALSQIAGMNQVEQVVDSFHVENLTAVIYFQEMNFDPFSEEQPERSEDITITIVLQHPVVTVVNEAPEEVNTASITLSNNGNIINSGDTVNSNSIINISVSSVPEGYNILVTYKDITNNAQTFTVDLLETTTGLSGTINLGSYDTTITISYEVKVLTGVEKAVEELAEQNNTVTIPSYDGVSESSIKSALSQIAGSNGVEQVVESFDGENLTAVIYFQVMDYEVTPEEPSEKSENITITIVIQHPVVTVVNDAPEGVNTASITLSNNGSTINSGDTVDSNSMINISVSSVPEGYDILVTYKDITNNAQTFTVDLLETTTGLSGTINLGSYDTTITLSYEVKVLTGIEKAVAELAEQNNTVTIPSYDGVTESSIKSALSQIAGMNGVEQVVDSFHEENLTAVIYFQEMNFDPFSEEQPERSEDITITIVLQHPVVTVVNDAPEEVNTASITLSNNRNEINSGDTVDSNSTINISVSSVPEGYNILVTYKDITYNAQTFTVDLLETTTGLSGVINLGSYDTTITISYEVKVLTGIEKAVAELAEQNNTVTIPSYDGVSESSIKSALSQIAGSNGVEQMVGSFDGENLTAVIYFQEMNFDPFSEEEPERSEDITITIVLQHPVVTVVNDAPEEVNTASITLSNNGNEINSGDTVDSNSIINISVSSVPEGYNILVTYKDITNNAQTFTVDLLETTTGLSGVINLGSYDTTITISYEVKVLTGIEKAVAELAEQDNTVTIPSYDGVTESSIKTALSQIAGMNQVEQVVDSFHEENLTAVIYFQETNFDSLSEEEAERSEDITITIVLSDSTSISAVGVMEEYNFYTVSFGLYGGITLEPVQVQSGNRVAEPEIPTYENYTFSHWYSFMSNSAIPFDFMTPILADTHLVATWKEG